MKGLRPQGAFLGMVETPCRFQAFEIGSDYLLGGWADEVDVEHVCLHELRKGNQEPVRTVGRAALLLDPGVPGAGPGLRIRGSIIGAGFRLRQRPWRNL